VIATPVSPETFKQSMRLLAGGVCILATSRDGEWHGLTMTAVCALTMDPPSLIACVNRDASAHDVMQSTRRVSVNVLSDQHTDIAELFSSPTVKGPKRFDRQRWMAMASGMPALTGALAVLDCRIVQETQLGQHSVFFCAIEATRLQPDERPLVHFNRAFCGIAALG
jgi:flavin reductase